MNINREYIRHALTVVVPVATGVIGFFAGTKWADKKYQQLANAEIAEVKAHYEKKLAEASVSTVEELPAVEELVVNDIKIDASGLVSLERYAVEGVIDNERNDILPDEEGQNPLDIPPPQGPFLIEPEVFHATAREVRSVTYFMEDDVLADVHENPIRDIAGTVGHAALQELEKDEVVYIRNPRNGVDYEVSREEGSYAELVLGKTLDDPKPKVRKFRINDE